jgi:hypothetical protein
MAAAAGAAKKKAGKAWSAGENLAAFAAFMEVHEKREMSAPDQETEANAAFMRQIDLVCKRGAGASSHLPQYEVKTPVITKEEADVSKTERMGRIMIQARVVKSVVLNSLLPRWIRCVRPPTPRVCVCVCFVCVCVVRLSLQPGDACTRA